MVFIEITTRVFSKENEIFLKENYAHQFHVQKNINHEIDVLIVLMEFTYIRHF